MTAEPLSCDLLVIGTGVAGAAAALRGAQAGLSVVVVTKEDDLEESATRYAQGGIVGPAEADSPESIAADILRAGAGASFESAVVSLTVDGPPLVRSLLLDDLGVEFDRTPDGGLHLTAEAAHACRRILHHHDATGLAIARAMTGALATRADITLLRRHIAVDLVTSAHHWAHRSSQHRFNRCLGAYVFDESRGLVRTLLARHVVLATGGLGQIFLHTTNPAGSTGDGVAMAWRAGARILNAEFVQFHPTAFFHRDSERFLISEAVRGEGARLVNHARETFMERYHPELRDLAPRDIVARAIYDEMAREGRSCVFLDVARFAPPDLDIAARFPTIHGRLLDHGIDMTRQPIPVVPAAHYSCGGVMVDLEGRTELPGLLAAGEVSCTGVHGANRLASTSLLEGLLWGWRAGGLAVLERSTTDGPSPDAVPPWNDEGLVQESDPLLVRQDFLTVKSTMWNYAGIVRRARRLERARADMEYLSRRIEQFYRETKLTRGLIELRNAVTVAGLVIGAALRNRQSQGCHYRQD